MAACITSTCRHWLALQFVIHFVYSANQIKHNRNWLYNSHVKTQPSFSPTCFYSFNTQGTDHKHVAVYLLPNPTIKVKCVLLRKQQQPFPYLSSRAGRHNLLDSPWRHHHDEPEGYGRHRPWGTGAEASLLRHQLQAKIHFENPVGIAASVFAGLHVRLMCLAGRMVRTVGTKLSGDTTEFSGDTTACWQSWVATQQFVDKI